MNKISVLGVARRHWLSVMARDDGRWPVTEIIVFIIFPTAAGILFAIDVSQLSEEFYSSLISCYSIFSALLLSVQMALFGIFQRQVLFDTEKNKRNEDIRERIRVSLIRELNVNVAFLVVLSVAATILSLVFLVLRLPAKIEVFSSFFLLSLFLVSILLVVRRAYILFDIEYSI